MPPPPALVLAVLLRDMGATSADLIAAGFTAAEADAMMDGTAVPELMRRVERWVEGRMRAEAESN